VHPIARAAQTGPRWRKRYLELSTGWQTACCSWWALQYHISAFKTNTHTGGAERM